MKGTSLLVLFFVQVQENIERAFSLAQKCEETKNTEIHTYMKNVIEKKECVNNAQYTRACVAIRFLFVLRRRSNKSINDLNGYKYLLRVKWNAEYKLMDVLL